MNCFCVVSELTNGDKLQSNGHTKKNILQGTLAKRKRKSERNYIGECGAIKSTRNPFWAATYRLTSDHDKVNVKIGQIQFEESYKFPETILHIGRIHLALAMDQHERSFFGAFGGGAAGAAANEHRR